MISKKIPMRNSRKSSFKGLVLYALDEQQKIERVGEVFISNCHSDTVEWAIAEIEAVQDLNQRAVSDKTYHLIVSFKQGENPSVDVLKAVEREMAEALGYGEHQRITVVHTDTDNLHMHMAINKIHPTKLTLHEPYRDHKTRDRVCDQLEDKYGLLKDNHKYNKTIGQGKAADMESHSGIQSLMTYAQQCVPGALSRSVTWQQFHEQLSINGLEIAQKGAGLIIKAIDGDVAIKASSVGKLYSKKYLEERFGQYEQLQGDSPQPQRSYKKKPVYFAKRVDALYEQYKAASNLTYSEKSEQLYDLKKERANELRRLKNAARTQRKLLRAAGAGGLKTMAKLLIQKQLKENIEQLNDKYTKQRLAIVSANSFDSYSKWVLSEAANGNLLAKKKEAREKKRLAMMLQYEAEKKRLAEVPKIEIAAIGAAFSREREQLEASANLKLKILSMSGYSVVHRFAMRSIQKNLIADIRKLDKRYTKKKIAIYRANKQPTFQEWLRQESAAGNASAQEVLNSRKAPLRKHHGHTEIIPTGPAKNVRISSRAHSTTGGIVVHSVAGTAIKDTGYSIAVPNQKTTFKGLEVALKLTEAKYSGPITFSGSAAIAINAVKIAANQNLNLTFADTRLQRLHQTYQSMRLHYVGHTGSRFNAGTSSGAGAVFGRSGYGQLERTGRGGRSYRDNAAGKHITSRRIEPSGIQYAITYDDRATKFVPERVHNLYGVPKRSVDAGQEKRAAMLLQSHVRNDLYNSKTNSVDNVRRDNARPRRRLTRFNSAIGQSPPDKKYIQTEHFDDVQELSQREIHVTQAVKPAEKHTPAELYCIARNKTRESGKVFDIPNHKRYTLVGKQTAEFAGVRNVAGNALLLLKVPADPETIYVKDIDTKTLNRLNRIKLGSKIEISDNGTVISSKGRSR